MHRPFLPSALFLLGAWLLGLSLSAQDCNGPRPTWATSSFKQTLMNSYLEVVVVSGRDAQDITDQAQDEIIRRRKLTVGESDPWIKSSYVAAYWECNANGLTGYFLYQTRKNPTLTPEAIQATDQYPLSPRVLVPGMAQYHKGQSARGTAFLLGEAALVGGIVAAESLKSLNVSRLNATHNNTLKQRYARQANAWNAAGYGFIAGAVALYAWNIIDGVVARGRPYVTVSPQAPGLALTLNF